MGAKITYASLKMSEADHHAYEAALQEINIGWSVSHTPPPDHFFDRDPSNPSNIVGLIGCTTHSQVSEAIAHACKASYTIRDLGWSGRREILENTRALVWNRRFAIAALLTVEAGKNRYEAMAEVLEVIAMIDFYEAVCAKEKNFTRVLHRITKDTPEYTEVSLEPVGPFAIISPFNFPFALAANMSISAFLAGNPLVFKPASDTILSTLVWRNILLDAGVPPEACALIVGPGSTVGEQLIKDPRIAGIAFTGSVEVGLHIENVCSQLRQRRIARTFVAEMGGKNPLIVTAHADILKAADGIVRSAVGFGGQKCSALSRVYVERSVAADLCDALLDPERLKPIRVGDPREKQTFVGPLINETAFNRYVDLSLELTKHRAKIVPLCDNPNDAAYLHQDTGGYFVVPILVTGIAHEDLLNKTEHFVPCVMLHEVASLDEAIKKANDSEFGLCAGIMSEDENEINEFLERIEAGVVYANRRGGATTGAWPGIQSFGGWKMSGLSGSSAFGPWYPTRFAREQCRTRAYDSQPT